MSGDRLRSRKRAASNSEPESPPQKKLAVHADLVWSGGPEDRAWVLHSTIALAGSDAKNGKQNYFLRLQPTDNPIGVDEPSNNHLCSACTGSRIVQQPTEDSNLQTSDDDAQSDAIDSPDASTSTVVEKPKKVNKQLMTIEQWNNQDSVYSETTMMSKAGKKGMELFLRSQGVDVDKEFPSSKWVVNEKGEKIARNTALMKRCQQVQGDIIAKRNANRIANGDATKTSKAKKGTTPANTPPAPSSDRVLRKKQNAAPLQLDASNANAAATQNLVAQAGNNSASMLQARGGLMLIRGQALEQLKNAHDHDVGSFAAMFFADPTKPIISTSVERLVFKIVECEHRIQESGGMSNVHATPDVTDFINELHGDRARLVYELQGSVKWDQDVDPVAMASRLVAEVFPAKF